MSWYQNYGSRWNVPESIRRLPFDLRRSHLYPRCPECVTSTLDEYDKAMAAGVEWEPPTYLPQRMAFSQYKTPPGNTPPGLRPRHSGPARTVVGPVIATRPSGSLLRTMGVSESPLASTPAAMAANAMKLNRLPRATTQTEVAMAIMAKGLPKKQGVMPAELARWTGGQVAQRIAASAAGSVRRVTAMGVARQTVRYVNQIPKQPR